MRNALKHPCVVPGCAEDGLFGEGVSLRNGEIGTWRCHAHWKEYQARTTSEADSVGGAQGDLLR